MTDTSDPHRFEHLLAGHANATLTADERAELQRLAAASPDRGRRAAEVQEVLDLFAAERALRAQVTSPADAASERGEQWQRLQAAAGAAGAELRSRLRHPLTAAPPWLRRRRQLRAAGIGALLAAAAVAVAAALGAFRSPPALLDSAPSRDVLGERHLPAIQIAPKLTADQLTLSWSPVWQARRYEAVIVDGAGEVLVRRSDDPSLRAATSWRLSGDEFDLLRRAEGELRLRVRALDGADGVIASSGDLPLAID